MKHQADKHRSEREFNVGDWVYLKLQPYAQMSVAPRSNQKLPYKYFGPYLILQRIGQVAYKLQLPPGSKIHRVIHVSQLKAAIPPTATVSADESLHCISDDVALVPAEIVQTKLLQLGATAVPHMLVGWTGLPEAWMTWENKNNFLAIYPQFSKCRCGM
jgi:hypothetical protein